MRGPQVERRGRDGVAEFLYFTGPMDCGKSTLALQFDYTHTASGRRGRLFTSQDRAGEATISSRLGLDRPAIEVAPDFDFWRYVVDQLTSGERIDYLVCDETQFYSAGQVDQLARVVDELQIDVFAVGILTDFKTRLFPGSQRMVELCDRMEVLQVRALCWCGERATHNARTVNGTMVTEGDQVVLGDTRAPADEDPTTWPSARWPACSPTTSRGWSHTRCFAGATIVAASPGRSPAPPCPTRCRSDGTRTRAAVTERVIGAGVLIEAGELADLLAAGRRPVLADVRWNLSGPPACRSTRRATYRAPAGSTWSRSWRVRRGPAAGTRCRRGACSSRRCGASASPPEPWSSRTTAQPRWRPPDCGGC